MAMTNAQRQAKFKTARKIQGHLGAEGEAMERLDVWVSASAAHGLRVLAELQGNDVQEELDHLLVAAIEAAKLRDRKAWGEASMVVLDRRSVTR